MRENTRFLEGSSPALCPGVPEVVCQYGGKRTGVTALPLRSISLWRAKSLSGKFFPREAIRFSMKILAGGVKYRFGCQMTDMDIASGFPHQPGERDGGRRRDELWMEGSLYLALPQRAPGVHLHCCSLEGFLALHVTYHTLDRTADAIEKPSLELGGDTTPSASLQ